MPVETQTHHLKHRERLLQDIADGLRDHSNEHGFPLCRLEVRFLDKADTVLWVGPVGLALDYIVNDVYNGDTGTGECATGDWSKAVRAEIHIL